MFGSLGFTELVLILIIVLIIFGAGKLPQLGEGLGKAIKGFKKSVQEADAVDANGAPSAGQPEAHMEIVHQPTDAPHGRAADSQVESAPPGPLPQPAQTSKA